MANKLLAAIAEPFELGHTEFATTASIGIAVYPRDGMDPEDLMRCADAAMYEAKAQGRDGYQFYTGAMSAVPRRRMLVEGKLKRAMENGDLSVYFQPRVDVERGVILGAEALARWHDPELGNIAPSEFIPIAEDSGLIIAIGEFVLDAACRETRRWSELGYENLKISVNLSGKEVRKADLRESVVQSLWAHGVDPTRLEFEITETALIDRQDIATGVLGELRAMGISIALDDFGTGFSSLSYLKRFPVSSIKIDQSFVRDILVDADDAAIVDAILLVAEKLRLGVVAEGVESIGQRDFLPRPRLLGDAGLPLRPRRRCRRLHRSAPRAPATASPRPWRREAGERLGVGAPRCRLPCAQRRWGQGDDRRCGLYPGCRWSDPNAGSAVGSLHDAFPCKTDRQARSRAMRLRSGPPREPGRRVSGRHAICVTTRVVRSTLRAWAFRSRVRRFWKSARGSATTPTISSIADARSRCSMRGRATSRC